MTALFVGPAGSCGIVLPLAIAVIICDAFSRAKS